MTFISRNDFLTRIQQAPLDLASAQNDPRLAGVDLHAADLNGDGRIAGDREAGALFEAIDRLDSDSDRARIRTQFPDGRSTRAAEPIAALSDRVGPMHTPSPDGPALTPADLQRNAAEVRAGAINADELRARYGIPGPRASGRDGFTARSEGRSRPIGLLRLGPDRTPELSVESAARRLEGNDREAAARRASVTRQLDTLREVDPRSDPALVMAVATRESGPAVLSSSRNRVDTFHQGGLDHLGDQVANGQIRPPAGYGPWRPGEAGINELDGHARGAMVPQNELLVAYGLTLQRSRQRFEQHVREVFPENADAMLRDLSPEAQRAWTQVTFGAPNGAHFTPGGSYGRTFGSRTALEMLRHEMEQGRATGLDDVLNNRALGRYTNVQRARVTAAEAESYERTLTDGS